MPTHPAVAALAEVARDFPGCWQALDELVSGVRAQGLTWPEWCWAPLAASYAVVSGGGTMPPERAIDVSRLAALAAWRPTQGIYRIDPTVLEELLDSELDGSLPVETLLHLPEWCVYVELPVPAAPLAGAGVMGFWCHLESDANDGRVELRILLHTPKLPLVPIILHLGAGDGTLQAAIDGAMREALALTALRDGPAAAELVAPRLQGATTALWPVARPLVSVVLYLCTLAEARVSRPQPKPGRRGEPSRWYPPAAPVARLLGERLGAELRAARQLGAGTVGQGGTGGGTTPHVRRAHWHTFLRGPRTAPQKREVRWLPPILVGRHADEGEPVIHMVLP